MCGILGNITNAQMVDIPTAIAALDTIQHRGPDGMGMLLASSKTGRTALFNVNPNLEGSHDYDICLGHRRLAIIDLSNAAAQPMCNEDKTVWITFNGEIYNHEELRMQLIAHGHNFNTDHSDTETLIHGWEQWGEDLLSRLNGMFAIAILDLKKQAVFLARDRFGEKPLYFTRGEKGISFASEMKAIMALRTTNRQISDTAVHAYLGFGYIPAPLTIFRDVEKLEAAHCITLDLNNPSSAAPHRYWELSYDHTGYTNTRHWEEEFHDTLQQAIESRMMSDVPLGVFLSGGLDSTIVLRGVRKSIANPIDAYTIGFHEKSHDETLYAKKAASQFKTRHHLEYLDEKSMLDALPIVQKHFDEPFADSSAIPTYLVSRLARKNVTVALSGDGGDELLAGYHRYKYGYLWGTAMGMVPGILRDRVANPLIDRWPESVRGKGFIKYARRYRYPTYMISLWDNYFSNDQISPLDYVTIPGPHKSEIDVNTMCHIDTQQYLPEDLMVKVDRASMAVSLESRAPLLDHRLFELAAQMPLSKKFNGVHGKLPFRKILTSEIGSNFVNRPKMGFSVPLGKWFRGHLRDAVNDTVLNCDSKFEKYVSKEKRVSLLKDHQTGSRDQSSRLWKLFVLETWHRTYSS